MNVFLARLLGVCNSETATDISMNQRPMIQDWQELRTMQTMSAIVLRQQRNTGKQIYIQVIVYVNKTLAYLGCRSSNSAYIHNLTWRRQ